MGKTNEVLHYDVVAYDKDYDIYTLLFRFSASDLEAAKSELHRISLLVKEGLLCRFHIPAIGDTSYYEPYDWVELYENFDEEGEKRIAFA